ncbi:hypothetical protein DFH94DRAFT_678300 [Russula ochroleuca]|uniref:Uncharacterized protein n=1 Tax=Russula ochroleuca TaxID=152965 RepID=A0A9P5N5T8_9AGAM|nr:hypothetical protein DFH94DRAFT_678300 [Russula ochroleuca]
MSGYINFAVVGGAIGKYIVQQHLKDKAAGAVKEVVVLIREGSKTTVQGDANVIHIDYSNHTSFKQALAGKIAAAGKEADIELFVPLESGGVTEGEAEGYTPFYLVQLTTDPKRENVRWWRRKQAGLVDLQPGYCLICFLRVDASSSRTTDDSFAYITANAFVPAANVGGPVLLEASKYDQRIPDFEAPLDVALGIVDGPLQEPPNSVVSFPIRLSSGQPDRPLEKISDSGFGKPSPRRGQIATYLSILDENGPLTLQSMHGTSPASSATLPDPDQAIVIATTSSTRSKGKRKADAQHSRSNRCHEQILTRVLKSRIINCESLQLCVTIIDLVSLSQCGRTLAASPFMWSIRVISDRRPKADIVHFPPEFRPGHRSVCLSPPIPVSRAVFPSLASLEHERCYFHEHAFATHPGFIPKVVHHDGDRVVLEVA